MPKRKIRFDFYQLSIPPQKRTHLAQRILTERPGEPLATLMGEVQLYGKPREKGGFVAMTLSGSSSNN